MGTVWISLIILVSAGKTCRDKVNEGHFAVEARICLRIQPNDLLILLTDHWISKSQKSRELLQWWTGQLLDEIDEYSA